MCRRSDSRKFSRIFSRTPNLGVESEPAGFVFHVCRHQGPTCPPTRNRRQLTLTESNICRHFPTFLLSFTCPSLYIYSSFSANYFPQSIFPKVFSANHFPQTFLEISPSIFPKVFSANYFPQTIFHKLFSPKYFPQTIFPKLFSPNYFPQTIFHCERYEYLRCF